MIQDAVADAIDFRSDDFEQYIEGCGSCNEMVLDLKSRLDKFKTKNSLHENTNK